MERRLTMLLACLLLSIGMAFAQTKVTGTVISQEDGLPIIGATVMVEGTKTSYSHQHGRSVYALCACRQETSDKLCRHEAAGSGCEAWDESYA